MKITVNQLRRIIKEEVGRVMEGEGGDEGREKMQRQLDIDAINTAIENLTNMLDKVSPVLRPGIETSIEQLKELLREEPYTDEDSMFESRGQKAKNRIETLESKIKKLEAKLEASKNKRTQTQKDEDEQERLESELDKLHQELLVARDPSMKESRRRSKAINEITEQEMIDELINALVGALENKLSDPDTQAKFLANLRGAAGVEVSPETLAREEEARKNMKDTGKKFKFLP